MAVLAMKAPRNNVRNVANGIQPLNAPRPLLVEVTDGLPTAVRGEGKAGQPVASVEDVWRIEEEWWRERPVVRTYFNVVLEDRRRLTVFHDHASGRWYTQRTDRFP